MPLREGLERTIEWTRENLDWIERCIARHADADARSWRASRRERPGRPGAVRRHGHRAAEGLRRGPTGASCGRTATCSTCSRAATSRSATSSRSIGALWAVVAAAVCWRRCSRCSSACWPTSTRAPSVPYPVFALLGMVTWLFFATALAQGLEQHRRQRGADLEGVLPAAGHPARRRAGAASSTSPSACVVALVVTLALRRRSRRSRWCCCPLLVPLRARGGARLRPVARRPPRQVPRHRQPRAVRRAASACSSRRSSIRSATSRTRTSLLYALNPMVGVLELMRWMVLPGLRVPGGAADRDARRVGRC